jgi:radical SAM protein with 4Fe4S-binding SPASM domain
MKKQWNLAPGTIFWANDKKGVIVNPLKHTQFECKPEIISFLSKKSNKIRPSDFLFLKDNGIIDFFDQKAFFKKLISMKKREPFDGIIYIEVTKKCNLRCIGCYNNSGMQNRGELTLNKAVEIADALNKIGNPRVIITGGEPLVVRNWEGIVSTFSKRFSTEIFSNGTLITASIAEKLKEINVAGVKISVDGASAEIHDKLRGVPGSFHRSIIGIKNLQAVGIPVTWQATISKANIHELEDMIKLAEDVGVKYFKASPLRSIGRAKGQELALRAAEELRLTRVLENAKEKSKVRISSGESFCDINEDWRRNQLNGKLTDIEKKFLPFVRSSMCDVGIDRFLFNFKGELRLCPLLSSDEFIIENETGKVSKETLFSNKFSSTFQKPLTEIRACRSCGVKYLCKGSCRGETLAYSGSLEGCNIRQREYFDYMLNSEVSRNVLQG